METRINTFLETKSGYSDGDGSGSGYGFGDGYGCGSGYSDGYGSGSGSGDGDGYGSGSGSGSGFGYGFGFGYGSVSGCGYLEFEDNKVYIIDSVKTIIKSIKGNVCRGYILNNDLTLTDCYIVKNNDKFAHGITLKEAIKSLDKKIFIDMPISERIEKFIFEHKSISKKYSCLDFFEWHYKLTGSCYLGRKSFASNHGIDIGKDKMTVLEFIKLTKNSYGSHVILELEKAYEKENKK